MRLQIHYVAVSVFKNTGACIANNQEISGQVALIFSNVTNLVAVVETQQGTATAISVQRAVPESQMVTI